MPGDFGQALAPSFPYTSPLALMLRPGFTWTREQMNPRKRPRRHVLSPRAADRMVDDIDPRDQSRRGLTGRKADRKTLQLCAQISDALNGLLAESHNEALQMLQVASVEPAPGASQLLVTVCPAVQPTFEFSGSSTAIIRRLRLAPLRGRSRDHPQTSAQASVSSRGIVAWKERHAMKMKRKATIFNEKLAGAPSCGQRPTQCGVS